MGMKNKIVVSVIMCPSKSFKHEFDLWALC